MDTVKKVFVFNQDPEKVLKLQKATAEQRAVCRLLMNPFLKDAVAAAKLKLDIKDEDEDWKKIIFEMGKHKIRKLKKDKFEAQAEATGEAKSEKVKKKAKKSPENKKDKDTPLDDKSKGIDKNNRKDKFDKKRKQFMKAKGTSAGDAGTAATPVPKPAAPIQPKKNKTPVGPPKKVHLFPVEARKDNKDFQKRPARDFGDSKPKKWNKDDRPQKSFAPRGHQPATTGFQRPKENSAKLHPSWEAKKAKKPTISNFQGKKITFDD